jgi:cell division protein FtsI (penicillin-binding protein 3)
MPGDFMNAMMQLSTDSNKHIVIQPKKMYRNIVPDVTGMGLKDAVYMLENSGLQVQVVGKGRVHGQSVPAGTKIIKGQNITLQLS